MDAALRSVGREGLDVVFDSLGGDYFMPAYARMKAMGRHVQYGAASMTPHGGSPNWPTLAYQGRNDWGSTFHRHFLAEFNYISKIGDW